MGSSFGGGITMTFSQSTRCLSSSRLSAQFAVLLLRLADPLDARISTDGGVGGIDHDHFVVFVGRILTDPVRVEDAQRPDLATDTLLGDGLKWTLEFHLIDAMVGRLAISASLGDGLLAGTTANADAVNDESLLRAISQSASLFDASRLRSPVHAR